METLSQNWLWIVLALGAFAFFYFRGSQGGHGGLGGFGLGGHGHGGGHGYGGGRLGYGGHGRGGSDHQDQPAPRSSEVVDPVSGLPVRPAEALTSVYQDRTYYFASKENRERFEASPQQYAGRATAGTSDHQAGSGHDRHGRRRGC